MEDENWQEMTPEQMAEKLAKECGREETAKANEELEGIHKREGICSGDLSEGVGGGLSDAFGLRHALHCAECRRRL